MGAYAGAKAQQTRVTILDREFQGWKKEVWDRRQEQGWSTVPRTLGLISRLIRYLSEKGEDLSRVYQELWYRVNDDGLVEIRDEKEIAFACGYAPDSRGVRSLKDRIRQLKDLGFVRTAKRFTQEHYYVFIQNPELVVRKVEDKGKLPEAWVSEYEKRIDETGARRLRVASGKDAKKPIIPQFRRKSLLVSTISPN